MKTKKKELMEYLILYHIREKPYHGYKLICDISEDIGVPKVSPSFVYPVLSRFTKKKYIKVILHDDKKVYEITDLGLEYLKENSEKLEKILKIKDDIREFHLSGGEKLHDVLNVLHSEYSKLDSESKRKIGTCMINFSNELEKIIYEYKLNQNYKK
ncbi:PadR family transcriptional regulator [Methanococcus voltae]|uniref:DNA-binding PadR family transcriptional regulator n=2 Tax=Methanococcus voltae TaxID=2188 RepID=A0A8J7UUW7_METVO|nr:PadR family transcriptional regulator [Methanococcus voltae]MBP2172824.1 DNA-binding PadR family transcriptional regulator [Methanococcus voltae]MBP2201766.1 DNA-binding PadR family transcriptional regulator [Methanococcus voltae]MCS3922554.1 DNA-binding PadR family transcriptional regulator [Methanococcus voltae PS]